jgi:membrane protein involved in D-alanine export
VIPYASFLYFGVAGLYILIPVAVLRGARASTGPWLKQACILVATVVMLAIQYSGQFDPNIPSSLRQIWAVAIYALGQYLVAGALVLYRRRWKAKWPGYLAVILALLPLLAAKFLPSNGAASATGPAGAPGATGLVEFIGLSYATLRAIDVLIEIHDGLITALPPGRYLAFLVFFPTVSSGPIDRFRRFSKDWAAPFTRAGFLQDLDGALHRIFTGFFYKFILAHFIYDRWLRKISEAPTFGHTMSYMYGYSLYLFFDFAGYSAFAIGFSYLLGIRTPENFAWPFLSRDIREFWTRWHITLSFWFRDFIYMRFLLFVFKKRWFRNKNVAAYIANFLTFGLMGFWHGTETRYLVYGVYHAILVTGHDLFARWNKPHPDQPARFWGNSLGWQIAGVLLTAHAVCFGFLIFSGRRL